jgi:hypothetical protein
MSKEGSKNSENIQRCSKGADLLVLSSDESCDGYLNKKKNIF